MEVRLWKPVLVETLELWKLLWKHNVFLQKCSVFSFIYGNFWISQQGNSSCSKSSISLSNLLSIIKTVKIVRLAQWRKKTGG